MVIDDQDRAPGKRFRVLDGTWKIGRGGRAKWNPFNPFATFRYTEPAADSTPTARAEWSTDRLTAGEVSVWAWWPKIPNGAQNVAYDIFTSGGTVTVTVDQSTNGGQWNLLGTYAFDAGMHRVQVNNGGAGPGTRVIADAIRFTWTSTADTKALFPGLVGHYFNAPDLTSPKLVRRDARVAFDWGQGSPVPGVIRPNHFSVRWTGFFRAPSAGTFTIETLSDDGVRLWLNDVQVIDDWNTHTITQNSTEITLTEGQLVPIKLEYFDDTGRASIMLKAAIAGGNSGVIPASALWSPVEQVDRR